MNIEFINENVNEKYPWISKQMVKFRKARFKKFQEALNIRDGMTILDVGGQPYYWKSFEKKCRVICLNLKGEANWGGGDAEYIEYDGGRFPFKDQEIDVVHSNSVIEHVGDYLAQKRFANEVMRVGKSFWVQTPNYYFFVEPHAFFPLFQFLPPNMKLFIGKKWKFGSYNADHLLSIQLLTKAQLKDLFTDCSIYKEKLLIFTKSLSAYRKHSKIPAAQ